MYLRFFGRLLDDKNALIYAPPFPLDSGNLSLFLASLASDMSPGASVLVNSFEVDDVFQDRYSRLSSLARTADDIGKVYHQQSDDTYWTLTAIGPPLVYAAFLPVAPALPAAGGGGGGPAPAAPTLKIAATISGLGPTGDAFTGGPGGNITLAIANADNSAVNPAWNVYITAVNAIPAPDAVGAARVAGTGNFYTFTPIAGHTGAGSYFSSAADSWYFAEADDGDGGKVVAVSNIVHVSGGAVA